MPHLILEYSSNLQEKEDVIFLFPKLHQILVRVANATLESCKSRAVEHKTFYVGNGDQKNAFVHLEIRLADGRSMEIRERVGDEMLKLLEHHFATSLQNLNLQITVESKEFSKKLYFKIPKGSV